jgi:hypothetical protein
VIPVARVEGEVISRGELERALQVPLAQLEHRRQVLIDQRLEELIDERLLAREARKRGLTVGELLKAEVDAAVPDVTDADVTALVARYREQFPQENETELSAKVADYLRALQKARRRYAYVQALRTQTPVTLYPEPAPAESLDAERYARVIAEVLPKDGYTLPVKWEDLGPRLVQLGVIDLSKLKTLYGSNPPPELQRLETPSEDLIRITSENASFLLNVLWGLGLANKAALLERVLVERGPEMLRELASTGGWTLGTKPAAELYGRFDILRLGLEQQELVSEIAGATYRPCCDNPTAFPDCNHGMALLGLIELLAGHGFSREEILKASVKVNAFWFPKHYVETALLFELRGVDWNTVNPGELLGFRYSSLTGWTQNVDRELKRFAHLLPPIREGASCGVSG